MAIKVAGQTVVDDNRRITGVTDDLPSIRPTLNLDFANSKQLDPRIDFTRSSTATYWDGKTTAKAEENLWTNSTTIESGTFGMLNGSTKVSGYTAPDGSSDAYGIFVTSAATDFGPRNNSNYGNPATICVSVYAKAGDVNYLEIDISDGAIAYYDLANGTVVSGTGASIQSVGNGWYRCILARSGVNTSFIDLQPSQTSSNRVFNGSQNTSVPQVYLWGPQVELNRSAPTAYTPTTGTPITRYQPVLQTASANQPRFDHDPVTGESKGLLIEEARTNYFPYSEDPNISTSENYITVVSNAAISPNGTQTADLFIPTSSTQACRAVWPNGPLNGTYCYSAYVKSNGLRYARIQTWSTQLGSARGVAIDFETGEAVNPTSVLAYGVDAIGSGWYRLWYSIAVPDGSYAPFMLYPGATVDGAPNTGNTINGFDGVYYWGAQVEAGSFPTSYIPTSGSQVTRGYDRAQITGTNFTSTFSQQVGTFYAEGYSDQSASENNGGGRFGISNDYAISDRVFVGMIGNVYKPYIITRGTTQTSQNGSGMVEGSYNKVAMAYAKDNVGCSINGGVSNTDSTVEIPEATVFTLHSPNNTSDFLNGCYRKIAYYPARLSDATLQAMTEE